MVSLRVAGALALAVALAGGCASRRAGPGAGTSPAALAPREVVVAKGESACALAGRMGVDVGALLQANRLGERADRPLATDRVRVPAHAGLRHRVRPGETLQTLGRWYGHPVDALAARNGIEDPDRIMAGTWLSIPPGARTGCAPAPPTTVARSRGGQVVARSAPRVVARSAPPPVARAPEPPATVAVAPAPEPEQTVSRAALARADAALEEAGRRYAAADFEATLELSAEARRALPAEASDPASVERRARASWLAGLANAGLDRPEEAAASLREALLLRPSLRDEESLSPRILGLLDEAPGDGR